MLLIIDEIGTRPNSTLSQLFVNGHPFCFILEDGYREHKIPGQTRIPGGRYQVIKRTHGATFEKYRARFGCQFVPEIIGVPDFLDILMHIGNTVKDTRGCPLTIYWAGVVNGEYQGKESTAAFMDLYHALERGFETGEIWIEINRREVVDENTPVG